jgi:hypothetical protein
VDWSKESVLALALRLRLLHIGRRKGTQKAGLRRKKTTSRFQESTRQLVLPPVYNGPVLLLTICAAHDRKKPYDNEGESPDSDPEDDEIAWRLDEASEEATVNDAKLWTSANNECNAPPEYSVDALVEGFVAHHPARLPASPAPIGRLAAPVILPQKRPRSKGRGFVRAYAPMLADCGIDQSTFVEFLDTFDKSTHVSVAKIRTLIRSSYPFLTFRRQVSISQSSTLLPELSVWCPSPSSWQ